MLVNCAGIDHDCPFLDFPDGEWERVLGVNLTGAFTMAQRVARVMAETGGGSIVHVSSIDAYGADGNQVAYNASKAGMLGLSRTMATELARHRIRSNVVAPGYTATPLTRQYVGEEMYGHMMGDFDRIPQRRMATPEEIAAAIAFLASGDAAAITGSELVVDGGTIANLYIVETLPPAGSASSPTSCASSWRACSSRQGPAPMPQRRRPRLSSRPTPAATAHTVSASSRATPSDFGTAGSTPTELRRSCVTTARRS